LEGTGLVSREAGGIGDLQEFSHQRWRIGWWISWQEGVAAAILSNLRIKSYSNTLSLRKLACAYQFARFRPLVNMLPRLDAFGDADGSLTKSPPQPDEHYDAAQCCRERYWINHVARHAW